MQDALQHYAWPGNVRELRNVIERAVVLSEEDVISSEHLPLRKITQAPEPDGPEPDAERETPR